MTSRTSQADADREHARERLRGMLEPGDTIQTILGHVSSSGMARWIRPVIARDNTVIDLSWLAAKAAGYRVNTRNHEGIEMGGAGMDMGFALVYGLSRALYPDGFACPDYKVVHGEAIERKPGTRGRCGGNDHFNRVAMGELIKGRHVMHRDGGYALHHSWL